MARQNRVTPAGEIVTTPERGTFMGNRGQLHDDHGHVRRAWQVKRWIVCVLRFKGRKRQVMRPGYYTELFFLDEATALAAGHRPCAECRRDRFEAFRRAWAGGGALPTAPQMDERLHEERMGPDGTKRTFQAAIGELPNGTFVTVPAWGAKPYLVWNGRLFRWSFAGYDERRESPGGDLTVLTPRSTVEVLRAGYHPSISASVTGAA
jgi:hypothetical protein